MLLHFIGVHGARGTCCKALSKNGFSAPASQTLQRRIIKRCEKTDALGGYVFFFVAAVVWDVQDERQCH